MRGQLRRGGVIRSLLPFFLLPCLLLSEDRTWKKLRYQGGTIEAKVNPFDWNTTLKLSTGNLELIIGGRPSLKIPPSAVTSLSYGQKAYRRVADMAALSVILTPAALFGILHKSRDHLTGIAYQGTDGHAGAVLLNMHKDDFREILQALATATGKPVENWPK